jgi:hypothetical protein
VHRDPEERRRYQNRYYKSTKQKERRAKIQRDFWQRRRARIFTRDDYTCFYCQRKFQDADLHLDHKIARHRGGSNADSNTVTACRWCNRVKSDKPICEQCRTWASPELLDDGTIRCARCHAINSFPPDTKTVSPDAEPAWITEDEPPDVDETGELGT